MSQTLVIATRGSQLALWQADYVATLLKARGQTSEKLVLKTTGDRVQDRFLHEIGGKGLFVKELETALRNKQADLAVHSLKDMPARVAEDFTLAAILKRHSPADCIVFNPRWRDKLDTKTVFTADELQELGPLTVGTGSLRRQAALKRSAPNISCVGIRGNVDTRLRKLHAGEWDAIILAEASLERLGIRDVICRQLDPHWFVPCAAQGALAIETRTDSPVRALLASMTDLATQHHVTIERNVLARLGGDCTMPFACHVFAAPQNPSQLQSIAIIYDQGGDMVRVEHQAAGNLPFTNEFTDEFTNELMTKLKAAGAARILRQLGIKVPAEFT